MRYPTDDLRRSPHPISCYGGFSDGYSGWYAVSDRRRCTDFCYWEVDAASSDPRGGGGGGGPHGAGGGGVPTAADPHRTTYLAGPDFAASWRCALGAAGTGTEEDGGGPRWSDVVDWRAAGLGNHTAVGLTPPGHFGPSFGRMRCHRGAGEVLGGRADGAAASVPLWAAVAFLAGAGLVAVGAAAVLPARRRRRSQAIAEQGMESWSRYLRLRTVAAGGDGGEGRDGEEEENEAEEDLLEAVDENGGRLGERDEMDEDEDDDDETSLPFRPSARFHLRLRPLLRALALLATSVGLAAVLAVAVLSLVELDGRTILSDSAARLTPRCSDPSAVCPAGDRAVDRPSSSPPPPGSDGPSPPPFSYLVASDAQLDWYDGESPDLGRSAVPGPCSSADSCRTCTARVGRHTNGQVRASVMRLLAGDIAASGGSTGPVPETLIVNGDLTAYYHPHERAKYETIYHGIDGLRAYFPSLGNHEIDHGSGATYGGDQWSGSRYCNSLHSVGYVRSGFCGHIPGFDPDRIVRYDPASLAYSWEEGRYHFVHTHYYPGYEAAGLDLRSSVGWLDRDVRLAHQAGLTTVLFVHAAQGLGPDLRSVLLGRKVAAIFAGHSHRCLMNKCVSPVPVYEDQVGNGTRARDLDGEDFDRCLPGTAALCGGNVRRGGMSLYYLRDRADGHVLPDTELYYKEEDVRPDRRFCRAPRRIFVNTTDNTMLCRRGLVGDSTFPPTSETEDGESSERIPVFWSGSASFETFLKVDFLEDRVVVNAMTASKGVEGQKYADHFEVPNAVYPYHDEDDLREVEIRLQ